VCGADEDLFEFVPFVELEVRREPEAVSQRVRQEARPGGRPDEGERREVERDARRPRTLAHHHVDAEVLHRQVQHLFGRAGHPVDLVDEEDLTGHQRRQDRGEVAGVLDRRTARHAQGATGLVRHDHRERGLPEPGRTGHQDVVGRAVLHRCGLEEQVELPADLALPDELGERLRAERAFEREFFR
jgi:hypothetical protein